MSETKKILKVSIKKAETDVVNKTYDDKVLKNIEDEENIIVIGPQNYNHSFGGYVKAGFDAGPNGKFMFIHQAMRKIFLNPDIYWTVVIYTAGYTEAQLTAMEVALLNKVGAIRSVRINVYDHLYNYLNTTDFDNWSGTVTEERKNYKIRRLHFYCHGLVFRLAMGITNLSTTDGDLDITTGNVHKIKAEAFSRSAKTYCFSCRTGLGNDKIDKSIYYKEKVSTGMFSSKEVTKQYNLYSVQSLAQKMANAIDSTVYAYLCRSEYSNTLNTSDELDFHDAYEAGQLGYKRQRKNDNTKQYDHLMTKGNVTEAEKKRYVSIKKEFERRKDINGGKFDPEGAKYGVIGGTTPEGVPKDMKTFIKMK